MQQHHCDYLHYTEFTHIYILDLMPMKASHLVLGQVAV